MEFKFLSIWQNAKEKDWINRIIMEFKLEKGNGKKEAKNTELIES